MALYGGPPYRHGGGSQSKQPVCHVSSHLQEPSSSSADRNRGTIPYSLPQTRVLAGGYCIKTWLLEYHGTNIIYEPPLSTMSLKLPSMSIFTYCPHVTDLSQPLTQELKGSPGAVRGLTAPSWESPLGQGARQIESTVGFANTPAGQTQINWSQEKPITQERRVGKKSEKFTSGASS